MKVAVYARFSSDNQRQESIDAQVRAIKTFCDKNNFDIIHIYQDEAQSAKTDKRTQFAQMISDSKNGLFQAIIVHKLDRFARNRYDSAYYKRLLKNNGVKLISVLEQLDDSPESVILESVLEGVAEYYSLNLAREVKKGMNENALKALHNGGIAPLGFNVNPDQSYSINPSEADSVLLIFNMYADGHGYGAIAQKLNEKGHHTKLKKKFGKNSIYEILRNEKYIGTYVFNKRLSKESGNRIFKSDDEVMKIEDALPRIVSNDLWNRVQTKMNDNRKPRRNATRYYLLTGKLTCGECGSAFVGGSYFMGRDKETKYFIYSCNSRQRKTGCSNKSIRADLLEDYIFDLIKNDLLGLEQINILTNKILEIAEKAVLINKDLFDDLTNKRDKLKRNVDKLFDLYLEGDLSKENLVDRSKGIQQQIDDYDLRLKKMSFNAFERLDENKIKIYLIDLRDKIHEADEVVKREIIEALLDKIVIHHEEVEINFKVDPLADKRKSTLSIDRVTQTKVGGGEEN